MTADNAAMPKVLGLYETHLTVADLKTSTDFYRDVVGLEPAASFEERKVAFLWVDDRKTGMLEGVAGKDRVALLDIELHLVFKAVLLEEAIDGRDVIIILMLGRLLRLRLDQDRALVADLVLVFDDEVEEAAELVELAADIGVEQCLVTFAAAPQHVVFAAELLRGIDAGLHRRGCKSEDVGIRIGRSARHIAAVGEEVRRAPEQLGAGCCLLLGEIIDDLVEVFSVLGESLAFRTHVGVMEVETPMLQSVYGGASAEPFKTHHNTLKLDMPAVGKFSPGFLTTPNLLEAFDVYFAERWHERDFRERGLPIALAKGVIIEHDIASEEEFRRQEFYTEFLARFGLRYSAMIGFTSGDTLLSLNLQRRVDDHPFDREEERILLAMARGAS